MRFIIHLCLSLSVIHSLSLLAITILRKSTHEKIKTKFPPFLFRPLVFSNTQSKSCMSETKHMLSEFLIEFIAFMHVCVCNINFIENEKCKFFLSLLPHAAAVVVCCINTDKSHISKDFKFHRESETFFFFRERNILLRFKSNYADARSCTRARLLTHNLSFLLLPPLIYL